MLLDGNNIVKQSNSLDNNPTNQSEGLSLGLSPARSS
jgi:hypothetical protein